MSLPDELVCSFERKRGGKPMMGRVRANTAGNKLAEQLTRQALVSFPSADRSVELLNKGGEARGAAADTAWRWLLRLRSRAAAQAPAHGSGQRLCWRIGLRRGRVGRRKGACGLRRFDDFSRWEKGDRPAGSGDCSGFTSVAEASSGTIKLPNTIYQPEFPP